MTVTSTTTTTTTTTTGTSGSTATGGTEGTSGSTILSPLSFLNLLYRETVLNTTKPTLAPPVKPISDTDLATFLAKLSSELAEQTLSRALKGIDGLRKIKSTQNESALKKLDGARIKRQEADARTPTEKALANAQQALSILGAAFAVALSAPLIAVGGLGVATMALALAGLAAAVYNMSAHVVKETGGPDISLANGITQLANKVQPGGANNAAAGMGTDMGLNIGLAILSIGTGVGAASALSKVASLANKAKDAAKQATDLAMNGVKSNALIEKVTELVSDATQYAKQAQDLATRLGGAALDDAAKAAKDAVVVANRALKHVRGSPDASRGARLSALAAKLDASAEKAMDPVKKIGMSMTTLATGANMGNELISGTMGVAQGGYAIKTTHVKHDADLARVESMKYSADTKEIDHRITDDQETVVKTMAQIQDMMAKIAAMIQDEAKTRRLQVTARACTAAAA